MRRDSAAFDVLLDSYATHLVASLNVILDNQELVSTRVARSTRKRWLSTRRARRARALQRVTPRDPRYCAMCGAPQEERE